MSCNGMPCCSACVVAIWISKSKLLKLRAAIEHGWAILNHDQILGVKFGAIQTSANFWSVCVRFRMQICSDVKGVAGVQCELGVCRAGCRQDTCRIWDKLHKGTSYIKGCTLPYRRVGKDPVR